MFWGNGKGGCPPFLIWKVAFQRRFAVGKIAVAFVWGRSGRCCKRLKCALPTEMVNFHFSYKGIEHALGLIFVTGSLIVLAVVSAQASAQTLTTLSSFDGTNGASPVAV